MAPVHAPPALPPGQHKPMATHRAATEIGAHVHVIYHCTVSTEGHTCKGAAGQPPVKVTVKPGVVIYEF